MTTLASSPACKCIFPPHVGAVSSLDGRRFLDEDNPYVVSGAYIGAPPTDKKPRSIWIGEHHYRVGAPPILFGDGKTSGPHKDEKGKEIQWVMRFRNTTNLARHPEWVHDIKKVFSPVATRAKPDPDTWVILPHQGGGCPLSLYEYMGRPWLPTPRLEIESKIQPPVAPLQSSSTAVPASTTATAVLPTSHKRSAAAVEPTGDDAISEEAKRQPVVKRAKVENEKEKGEDKQASSSDSIESKQTQEQLSLIWAERQFWVERVDPVKQGDPQYCYTVGLEWICGHPDIVVTGCVEDQGVDMLRALGKHVQAGDVKLVESTPAQEICLPDVCQLSLKVVPVPAEAITKHFSKAMSLTKAMDLKQPPRYMQVIWPDFDGHFTDNGDMSDGEQFVFLNH